jgi:class 3 adenylate cyclase
MALVRKVVTVVFCDLAGYTSTGNALDPEALRTLQSRYFDEARTALERHGGTVEKFIGDAVMAVFGIPVLHEDDALRALRAAVELRDAVEKLGFQARIGVNTGEVVAGSGDALVTGDAVNVAARLEQAAEPGEILLGEPTLALAREAVEVEAVEAVAARGKPEPVTAYRLLRVVAGAPALERRLDAPLVGRHEELARLRSVFDEALAARACSPRGRGIPRGRGRRPRRALSPLR